MPRRRWFGSPLLSSLALVLFLLTACGDKSEQSATTDDAASPQTTHARRGKAKARGHKRGKVRSGAQAAELPANLHASTPAVQLVINTHDWYYHDKSAETLDRIIDILTKYGVKGEFYLTDGIFRTYEEHHPEIIQRLIDTGMTISYHLRVPHPVAQRSALTRTLLAMGRDDLMATLRQYETHALNLKTGAYDKDIAGGYAHIKERIGYAPPVLGMNPFDDRLRDLELTVLKEMGLRMWVRKHSGDILEMTDRGVLSRPSEFAIEKVGGHFWWEQNQAYDPATLLAGAQGYGVVLVHENNFHSAQPGWKQVYYKDLTSKPKPKHSPWDTTATEAGFQVYSPEHVAQIWANYESFVKWASENLRCVTSREIIADWEASQGG